MVCRFLDEREDGLYFGVMGIVEAPEGTLVDECIIPVIGQVGDGCPGFVFGGEAEEGFACYAAPASVRRCDLCELLDMDVWSFPGERDGGGIMLRRTMMKARPGHEILAAVGVWRLNSTFIDYSRVHEIVSSGFLFPEARTSRQGFFLTPGERFPELFDPMDPLQDIDILRQPIWGWDEEKLAFVSTLHLKVASRRDLIADLLSITPARRVMKMGGAEAVDRLLGSTDAQLLCHPHAAERPYACETASRNRMRPGRLRGDFRFARLVGEEHFGQLVSNGRAMRHKTMRTRREKRNQRYLVSALLPDIVDNVTERLHAECVETGVPPSSMSVNRRKHL